MMRMREHLAGRSNLLWVSIASVVGLLSIFLLVRPAVGETRGYEFSNLLVTSSEPGVAHVVFDYSWKGDVYPGTSNCDWIFDDATGKEIASISMPFASLSSSKTESSADFSVNGQPATVEVVCDPPPPPDPNGDYSFTELRIIDTATGAGSPANTFVLGFHALWVGAGPADARLCNAELSDSQGNVVINHQFNILMTAPTSNELRLTVQKPTDVQVLPTSTHISCEAP
jgi:hypothetical protein